jgi:hypothetical protein
MRRLDQILDGQEAFAIEAAAQDADIGSEVGRNMVGDLARQPGGRRMTDHHLHRLALAERKRLGQHPAGDKALSAGEPARIGGDHRHERDVIGEHDQPEQRTQQHEQNQ